jgi:GTPase SAR1 family protein
LIGNKIDLQHLRKVSIDEGILLAKKFNIAYMESSAKDNCNIEMAFKEISR